MKKFLSIVISLMLVLSMFGFAQAQTGASSNAVAPLRPRAAAAVKFVQRRISQGNRRLRYTIKAEYPQAVGANRDARLLKLNQALQSLIAKQVAAFKKDFVAPEKPMGEAHSYFDSSYVVSLATNDLVSIAFGISTFYEGAAHPNHNSLVFNYDLTTGRVLNLADLFKPKANYLRVMSGYAIEALRKEMSPDPDMDWIKTGAGAKRENYKNWNITPNGLEVTFDPYQVASYAEGEHVVVIPYNVLKDVINPNGPLARMGK